MVKTSKLEMFNCILLVIILILLLVCCIRKCNEKFSNTCSSFSGYEQKRCIELERKMRKTKHLGVIGKGRAKMNSNIFGINGAPNYKSKFTPLL